MAEKSAELSTPVNLAAASQCERVLDGLCVNHNPDHVTTPHHKRQLAAFLRRLGVRNAPELVSRNLLYTLAADLVAERLDLDIAAGIDPMETAISPGAAIHGMIRKQAERLQTSPNLSAIPTPTSPDYAQTNQPSRFMEGR